MGKKGEHSLYRIGEAAALLDLKTCVLRFWEGEFPQLVPVRTPKGQRLYREEDMAVLRRIRSLLHEQGMTIDGARRVLAGEMAAPASPDAGSSSDRVSAVPFSGQPENAARRASVAKGRGAVEPGSVVAGTAACAQEGQTAALREAVAELRTLRQLLAQPEALTAPQAVAGNSAGHAASSPHAAHAGAFVSPEGGLS